jgi:hypothetical protein
MSEHARIVNGDIIEFRDIDPSVHAAWIASGNPKSTEFRPVFEEVKPPYDERTQSLEAFHIVEPGNVIRSWSVRPKTADELRQVWSSLEFLNRFTDSEMMAIENGRLSDPYVQAFYRSALAAQEIVSDDPRTIAGMDYIMSIGIIDETRKEEILNP